MAAASIATELTCSICLELFEDPICLPCMHSFCKECLHQFYVSKSTVYGKVLDCPACRRAVHLNDTGIEGLPKNFTLANIVENYLKNAKENNNSSVSGTNLTGNNVPKKEHPKSDDGQVMYCLQCQAIISEGQIYIHADHGLIDYQEVQWNLWLASANASNDHSISEDEQMMFCLQCREVISDMVLEQHRDHGLIDYQEGKWNFLGLDGFIDYFQYDKKRKDDMEIKKKLLTNKVVLPDETVKHIADVQPEKNTADPEEIRAGEIKSADEKPQEITEPVPQNIERFPRFSLNELKCKRKSLKKVPEKDRPIDCRNNDRIANNLGNKKASKPSKGTAATKQEKLKHPKDPYNEQNHPKGGVSFPGLDVSKHLRGDTLEQTDSRNDKRINTKDDISVEQKLQLSLVRNNGTRTDDEKKTPPPVPKRRIFFHEKKPIKGDDYDIICEHESPVTRQKLSARALYRYEASYDFEISFNPGDIIKNIEQMDEEWWTGLAPDGSYGRFPAKSAEMLP